ncbi:hypothetical protein GCM10011579_033020 [Streptomyces albiflavescens]|uniref:Lipoprotein n=1 Tax=Streptomyces albiflavescens TaxID=1623582 RepID=A0A917Y326_9ACTN|nr:DUF6174 domain-containing protein [Streptomyces albiflavescens]GGN64046.1 hypothetical protein GCM10011579_033020 [Streptomyces albiflavescens]
MTAVRSSPRLVSAAVLTGVLMCAAAGCGGETSTSSGSTAETGPKSATAQRESTWEEPSSYAYTLKSSEGERSLIGTFRVTVQHGKVTEAVGLDESGRRVVKQSPDAVPTIRELLEELDRARHDQADAAEVEYAADGHPVRISLDWQKNAIDDEALYIISAYEPAGSQ